MFFPLRTRSLEDTVSGIPTKDCNSAQSAVYKEHKGHEPHTKVIHRSVQRSHRSVQRSHLDQYKGHLYRDRYSTKVMHGSVEMLRWPYVFSWEASQDLVLRDHVVFWAHEVHHVLNEEESKTQSQNNTSSVELTFWKDTPSHKECHLTICIWTESIQNNLQKRITSQQKYSTGSWACSLFMYSKMRPPTTSPGTIHTPTQSGLAQPLLWNGSPCIFAVPPPEIWQHRANQTSPR